MNLLENLRIALGSLAINRLRAVLTTLGIVIGVAAVVALVSLGNGVQAYITGQFSDLGATRLTVQSIIPSSGDPSDIDPLKDTEAEDLDRESIAPDLTTVAATYAVSAIANYGSESVSLSVTGVTSNYAEVNGESVRLGRFISDKDIDDNARVAVLGVDTVEDLFGSSSFNPVGLSIQINRRIFEVIGVMAPSGTSFFGDEYIYVPITTAQSRLANARVRGGAYEVAQIQAQAVDQDRITDAIRQIEQYLNDAHNILSPEDADFTVTSQANILDSLTQITTILTIFLGAVAGISLLVGGIGVMNIMLVSVTERTREIGLRKAVGARSTDILGQFLIESIVLTAIGGTIGVLAGWLVLTLAGTLIPDLSLTLTMEAVLLATVVTSFIGIFFGLYPAGRAAAMRPIDALRFE